MKKIKGGKRKGAGRKKTGRKTKVVSFSVPNDFVEELNKLVKGKLSEYNKSFVDLVETGVSITNTDSVGKVKRIDPLSEEGLVVQQIAQYEAEIKTLGTGSLGTKRKKQLEGRIYGLRKQLLK